jgi:F-type H+-transporting ATPase subunit delta
MIVSVARRYARALLEVGVEQSAVDAFGAELAALVAAMTGSPDLRNVLTNPAFSREQRHAAFDAAAGVLKLSASVGNLMKLLVDRGRAAQVVDIARVYGELADDRAGRARAQVWTASPLSPELSSALEKALSGAVKLQVTVQTAVDGSLLGGAVAQVGSYLFDGSVKGRLKALRRELKRS